jgi:hypothetical protein
MDIACSEAVEADLDQLIVRRSRQNDPDEESDLWRETLFRYQEGRLKECGNRTGAAGILLVA